MRTCLLGPIPLENDIVHDINYVLQTEDARLAQTNADPNAILDESIPYPNANEKAVMIFNWS